MSESRQLLISDFRYFTIEFENQKISFAGEILDEESDGLTPFCFFNNRDFYEYGYRNIFVIILKMDNC